MAIVMREPAEGNMWKLFGVNRDGDIFDDTFPHTELLEDVKREAETYP
jgi:hypothetical protein